jgi:hypothetical protein
MEQQDQPVLMEQPVQLAFRDLMVQQDQPVPMEPPELLA